MIKHKNVGIAVFVLFIASIVIFMYFAERKSIFEYNEYVWNPYISGVARDGFDEMGRNYEGMQENGKDYINYFSQATRAIDLLLQYKNEHDNVLLDEATDILTNLSATFERNGKFPRPEYKDFQYGWVSSMDAPTVMVASQMLFEITHQQKWKDFVNELMAYVSKSSNEGGYNLYYSDENGKNFVWPMEYIEYDTNYDNAQFVLNGSMVGYLGVLMIADLYESDELYSYLESVKKTYAEKFPEFHYTKYPWTFYMLNPKTVIPPHYIIFEKQLFEAINMIEPDSMFEREISFRASALKNVLEPQFRSYEEGIEFIIRRACAPHPYLLDIYGTRIDFKNKDGKCIETFRNNISGNQKGMLESFSVGEYLSGVVSPEAETYTVYAEKGSVLEELFSGSIEEITYSLQAEKMEKSISVAYDIQLVGDKYELDPQLSEKGEARITYSIEQTELDSSAKGYWGIELDNLSNQPFALGLLIYDSEGTGVGRYYPELLPGKNLILLSEIGFSDIDSIKDIQNIAVRIYTNESTEKCNIETGDIYKFEDLFELRDYVNITNRIISPQ